MVSINTTNWNDFVSAFPQIESRLIGFDRVFDAVQRVNTTEANFPPYNIKKIDDENYEIQIALAGFSKSELDITVEDGNLIVKGEQAETSKTEYLHKGIAERNFTRTWSLADTVKVSGSELKDGVLTINLVNKIPEELKPQSIKIK
jgi:molecular chaperone IbpA|tara:strand:+ start:6661 stop:7098 length:438 start_codon:yes stop_codon:yes gene_type:complete